MIDRDITLLSRLTVSENLKLVLHASAYAKSGWSGRLEELIQRFHLEAWRQSLPHELSTSVHRFATTACALAKDTDILLLDQIQDEIGTVGQSALYALLKELAKDRLIIQSAPYPCCLPNTRTPRGAFACSAALRNRKYSVLPTQTVLSLSR